MTHVQMGCTGKMNSAESAPGTVTSVGIESRVTGVLTAVNSTRRRNNAPVLQAILCRVSTKNVKNVVKIVRIVIVWRSVRGVRVILYWIVRVSVLGVPWIVIGMRGVGFVASVR